MSHLQQRMRQIVTSFQHYLPRAPEPLRRRAAKVMDDLQALLAEARPPRLALIGAPSDAAALVRALAGRDLPLPPGAWLTVSGGEGALDVLALQPGAPAPEALEQDCPDAIVLLCPPAAAGACAPALETADAVRAGCSGLYGAEPPLLGVLTPDLDEAAGDRRRAGNQLQARLRPFGNDAAVVAVADGDGGWQVEPLLERLLDALAPGAQLGLARFTRSKAVQTRLAGRVIHLAALATTGVGITPIPIADLPVITSLQLAMITGIAYISGRRRGWRAVAEFLGAAGLGIGAGFALREVARGLLKLIPVAGDVVSGAVAGYGTRLLGQGAIAYFIDGVPAQAALGQARDTTPPP